jgi:hypothetical protein
MQELRASNLKLSLLRIMSQIPFAQPMKFLRQDQNILLLQHTTRNPTVQPMKIQMRNQSSLSHRNLSIARNPSRGKDTLCPRIPRNIELKHQQEYILKALDSDQVDPSVHLNPKGKRTTATLYVRNLEFNANEEDLHQALDIIFQRIRVDKITIPRVDGRSKYGFIEISWAHHAPVKLADLCIKNSGMIQVNPRPIYFRELCNPATGMPRTSILQKFRYIKTSSGRTYRRWRGKGRSMRRHHISCPD